MKHISVIWYFVLIGIVLWAACTSQIYGFKNPSKTQTEIFLHIPKSFVLDFSPGVQLKPGATP